MTGQGTVIDGVLCGQERRDKMVAPCVWLKFDVPADADFFTRKNMISSLKVLLMYSLRPKKKVILAFQKVNNF
jgi:hypothetical protein